MKLTTRILSLFVLAAIAISYTGCDKGGDDNQSEEQKQFDKLKSTWTLVKANDGKDRTGDFSNLVLTIGGTFAQGGTYQYSFTGTRPNPSPWPGNGQWKFGAKPATQIIRDPGSNNEIDMTYEATATSLVISFVIPEGHPGFQGSRVQSVSGQWTFEFAKQ